METFCPYLYKKNDEKMYANTGVCTEKHF